MRCADIPLSYGILLYPGFEILDVAGPLECLNTLSRREQGKNLKLHVIARGDSEDPTIPIPITPGFHTPKIFGCEFQSQQIYLPTCTLETAPALDVLLVPGGFGSLPPSNCEQEVAFLSRIYPSLKYLITVCTGSGLAAAAGLLSKHYATTNKSVWDDITPLSASTYWVAHARWIVSGNIWTTSGVSAGTDGMFAFLEHVYGSVLVKDVAARMEYIRVESSAEDPFAKHYGAKDVAPTEGEKWWSTPVTTWKGYVVTSFEE